MQVLLNHSPSSVDGNIDRGKFTAMIFIDLKKAFDTVDYQILLNKMRNYGIDGLEYQWFSSNLDNRRQFCKVNGFYYDPAEISIGVPQGSCLGSLCFFLLGQLESSCLIYFLTELYPRVNIFKMKMKK